MGFVVTRLGGNTRITETSTTTVATTVEETIPINYAVDLEGCSISNKTCTFQIMDVTLPGGGQYASLGEGNPCLWLDYGPANAGVTDAASSCTVIPAAALTNGGSATMFAKFQDFGGGKGPVAGESLYGCIAEKWYNGTGCLVFLGNFTP